MKPAAAKPVAPALPRRDLMAIFAYVTRQRDPARCVDGSFEPAEAYLDRLAAAARMQ